MNYCIQMSQDHNINIIDIINNKMDRNEKKYSVSKANDVGAKYDKF